MLKSFFIMLSVFFHLNVSAGILDKLNSISINEEQMRKVDQAKELYKNQKIWTRVLMIKKTEDKNTAMTIAKLQFLDRNASELIVGISSRQEPSLFIKKLKKIKECKSTFYIRQYFGSPYFGDLKCSSYDSFIEALSSLNIETIENV